MRKDSKHVHKMINEHGVAINIIDDTNLIHVLPKEWRRILWSDMDVPEEKKSRTMYICYLKVLRLIQKVNQMGRIIVG